MMRDYYHRCARKGIADQPSRAKVYFDGCADRWKEDATHRQEMSQQGHTKGFGTLGHKMRRTNNHIHLGRLKIKQIEGHTLPAKNNILSVNSL